MLIGSKILFLHAPRTAGNSITQFLIDNVPERLTLLAPSSVPDHSIAVPRFVRAKATLKRLVTELPVATRVDRAPGTRHERLTQAANALARFNRRLDEFDCIISVMRNPYDLEVSRYHYLRKGYLGAKNLSVGLAQDIAFEGDFTRFAESAPYFGRLPSRIEDWFELNGKIPENLVPLRFEALEPQLERIVGQFYQIRRRLGHLGASRHDHYRRYLTPAAEAAIHGKFRWLFDRGFYARER